MIQHVHTTMIQHIFTMTLCSSEGLNGIKRVDFCCPKLLQLMRLCALEFVSYAGFVLLEPLLYLFA